ncbi:MAG: hypothetical protein AB7F86_16565 [Bdellovibrionales bacterium]
MIRWGLRSLILIKLSILLGACADVGFLGHGSEKDSSETASTSGVEASTPSVPDSQQFFKLTLYRPDGIIQSSELKWANGVCQLDNLFDFPDEIFGDNYLDNLTHTALPVPSCGRLQLAQILASQQICTAESSLISGAERQSVLEELGVQSLAVGDFSQIPMDLQNANITIQLDSSCLCFYEITPPAFTGGTFQMKVPPTLSRCSAHFNPY